MLFSGPSRFAAIAALAAVACAGAPNAQAQVRIIGYLGNFDVYNETEHECNEFEIELEGVHPEDVYHTYHNGNYGPPDISALPGDTGIRVVYSTPNHATAPNSIEHFGVSIRAGRQITAQRFQWVIGGVNPPLPLPPPPPPPPPLAIPLVNTEIIYLPTGGIVRQTVTNVDPLGRVVWVQRREVVADREVSLEELMPDTPLIKGATPVDADPERLFVGEPLIIDEDAPPAGELNSEVVVYDVYSNRRVFAGGEWADAPGNLITCILTASVTMGDNCPDPYLPVVTAQPADQVAPLDGAAFFTADAVGPEAYGDVVFQWRHESTDIPGEDNPVLEIDPVTPESAGAYTLIVSNDCGFVMSHTAYLRVEVPPICPADHDEDGAVNSQDFFDFLDDFFHSRANADLVEDGRITSQDFFEFLAHFFAGC